MTSRREVRAAVERCLAGGSLRETIDRVPFDVMITFAAQQGVEGLVLGRLVDEKALEAEALRETRRKLAQSELWFDHLRRGVLKVLACLDSSSIRATPLKGPLLADRLYPAPSRRLSSDIDVLVHPDDLERASIALTTIGYERDDATNPHMREAAHHVHLHHALLPTLELHFHANDGFGAPVLATALFERAIEVTTNGVRYLQLHPDDELAYLAIHAAGHRFCRLLWLLDLKLAIEHGASVRGSRAAAEKLGARRAFELAMDLLHERLDVPVRVEQDHLRFAIVRRGLRSAEAIELHPLIDSAATFVTSIALCDHPRAAGSYVARKIGEDLPQRLRAVMHDLRQAIPPTTR